MLKLFFPTQTCILISLDITGQQDDSRMAVSMAITAIRHGAYCLNYTKTIELIKSNVSGEERVVGAKVLNTLTSRFESLCTYLKDSI